MTKIGLDFGETIEGKFYPPGCVIDIFDKDAKALVDAGRAHYVPEGTMARLKAYGVPGCNPPQQPIHTAIQDVFIGAALDIADHEPENEGTTSEKNKKTNTLKK